jgi:hypothetical protein
MTLRRATERLREVGSLPLLLSALLIAAGGDLSAQSRSRPSDSSDRGGSRVAQPRDSSSPSRPSTPPSRSPSSPPRSTSPSSPSSGSDSGSPSASPSSPSDRRYAVPGTPGGTRRQPPSRDRNDPNWRGGGHRGDWYGHGGYYYPRWYRYYGPGWWWAPYGSWGWWLGDNYWPYDPYHYNYPYDRYDRGRGYYDRDEVGALDLDISPGRTQVFLDGQYLGTVDQYDGFPTYLWLEKGTYDIAFYLDGYKTLARQVSVYPGAVIDMEDRLEPGESVRPEDLVTKSHDRRDERLRHEEDRRERIGRGDRPNDDDDADWRDRVRRGREDRRDRGEEIEIKDEDEDGDDNGRRSEQGRVRLEVEPDDASIYLDGKFIGTGHDLANLRRGLLVEPGKHSVSVVRPGRESEEREFEVEPGEELELEIELETTDR